MISPENSPNTLKTQSLVGNLLVNHSQLTACNWPSATGRPQLAVRITTTEMTVEKKNVNERGSGKTDRAGKELTDLKVVEVSKYIKVSTTKVEPEKVTDMVGTFLKEGSNSLQTSTTKMEPEKVTDMVGTFLIEGSNGFPVSATQMASKRLPMGTPSHGGNLFE